MKPRILVVDDDELVRLTIRKWLEREGYDVIAAEDGKSGLKAARQCEPDLILLDITMPRMNGFEVLQRLGKREETMCIPVIMVTGVDTEEAHNEAMYQYADSYLVKPVPREELRERVASTLKRHGVTSDE